MIAEAFVGPLETQFLAKKVDTREPETSSSNTTSPTQVENFDHNEEGCQKVVCNTLTKEKEDIVVKCSSNEILRHRIEEPAQNQDHKKDESEQQDDGFQKVMHKKRTTHPKRHPSPKLKNIFKQPFTQRKGKWESSTNTSNSSDRKVNHLPTHK